MLRVDIGGVEVEVDEGRTKAFMAEGGWWAHGCQCPGCLDARMARRDGAPSEQTEILKSLGFNPLEPTQSYWVPSKGRSLERYLQRVSIWFAFGRIVGGSRTPQIQFDRFNSMWVDSERASIRTLASGFRQWQPDEPGTILVVTSNRLLTLSGEVCSFRQDYSAAKCPDCENFWRMTGYLKKGSLIPDWKGLPELTQILKARKKRVYVEFCVECGRMEYRIVDRKRPFRKKNRLYRDWQRRYSPGSVESKVFYYTLTNEEIEAGLVIDEEFLSTRVRSYTPTDGEDAGAILRHLFPSGD